MTFPRLTVLPGTAVQVADYPAAATFGPRRLSDFEFVWILRGSAVWTVREVNHHGALGAEHHHQLRPGTLGLARAGTVDSYRWDETRSSTHAYVHFDIPERGPLPAEDTWPATRVLTSAPILDGICSYLLELAGQPSAQARARSDELVRLLLDLFVTGPLEEPAHTMPEHLPTIVEHVGGVWRADGMRIVEVPELAAAAHLSAGHVFRLFREQYGCGPARAFELVRLARAAVSLQRSNATIAEVAELTGFANPYHFSRRFAAAFGAPPGTFRSLQPSPDPLEPIRSAGLLPIAYALLSYPTEASV